MLIALQSNDGRRFGAIVVNSGNGQVRLIDNVPATSGEKLICGGDHPPPPAGEKFDLRAPPPVQEQSNLRGRPSVGDKSDLRDPRPVQE